MDAYYWQSNHQTAQTSITNNGRNTKANNKWKANIKAKKKQEVDEIWIKAQTNKTATTRADREEDQPAENQENSEKTKVYITQTKDSKQAIRPLWKQVLRPLPEYN